jgi:hypothetical protein
VTLLESVEILKSLRDPVDAPTTELNEHVKLVCYKNENYEQILTEKELEKV